MFAKNYSESSTSLVRKVQKYKKGDDTRKHSPLSGKESTALAVVFDVFSLQTQQLCEDTTQRPNVHRSCVRLRQDHLMMYTTKNEKKCET